MGFLNMSDSVTCGRCGEPIIGEQPNLDPAQRTPCPKCGSTTRTFGVQAHVSGSSSVSVQADVVTYPQNLLTVARNLIDQGQFSISVIVAHMACEVATERSLSDLFAAKGIQHLEDAILEFLNGYNLANDRIWAWYTALTGNHVQGEGFWQRFKDSAKRRNLIMHGGTIVGKPEAEASLEATSALVAYLKK